MRCKSLPLPTQSLTDLYNRLPLFDFVTADLPTSTQAPELDDTNTAQALKRDVRWTGEDVSQGSAVTVELLGLYMAYLRAIDFIPSPSMQECRPLPSLTLTAGQQQALRKVGGRGMLT